MPTLKGVVEGLTVALILAAGAWVLSRVDAEVPLWALAPAVLIAIGLGFIAGRISKVGEDLSAYHADHLGDAVLTLQGVLSGTIQVGQEEFIERGLLGPARYGLTAVPNEDIRLSVLVPDQSGTHFTMAYQEGHSVGRTQNFILEIAGSFSGHAFQSGELEWTNDVHSDPRWRPHPQAAPGREYRSLASVPIRVGDDVTGVLNVISTERGAFLQGDLTYIELLATLVGLVWAITGGAPTRLPQPPQGSLPESRNGETDG